MVLKVVDDGGMEYPKVVNSETEEAVENVLYIRYDASPSGRVCHIGFVGEAGIKMEYIASKPTGGF